MDDDRIRAYFGRRRLIEGAEVLEKIARERVPAEIQVGGDLKIELAQYEREIVTKAAADDVPLVGL